MEYLKSFGIVLAAFVGGFMLMIGFLNLMAWLFGKTVAIWLGWIVVIFVWVGIIAASSEKPMCKKERDALVKYAKKVSSS